MVKKDKKNKGSKAKAKKVDTNAGLQRVLNKTAIQPNWKAFSEFVKAADGPTISPKHVGIVLTGYKYFQKSDSAVSAREEAAAEKAAAKEERDAAREARAKERDAAKAEAEEKKAARDKAAKEKAAKATKSPAAASKGKATPKASAGKAAAKKTAAKKTTSSKGKGKSAF